MSQKQIEATAVGQGYYRVFVGGQQVSQHIAEREAMESAGKQKQAKPSESVYYDHDYRVNITLVDPPVIPPPPPPPVASRIKASNFRLIGGWRVPQEFSRGGLAIDWTNRRLFAGGAANDGKINEFELSNIGTGESVSNWPVLQKVTTHNNYWGRGVAGGLRFESGTLWVSPRVHYDTAPTNLALHGKNLTTGQVTSIPTSLFMPKFGGGFIKGHTETLVGCGGYESGQGSVSGPTCAKVDGTVLLDQANHGTLSWDAREKRPASYSVASDSWVGLAPRNGEGRWASDVMLGGGIWLPNGLCFWPRLGTGLLDYSLQSECFAQIGKVENWFYSYDAESFSGVQFEPWTHGKVHGHEVGPDGLVYLLIADSWKSGMYHVDSTVKVFEVVE